MFSMSFLFRLFVSELFFCMREDVRGCFAALCFSVPDVDVQIGLIVEMG